MIRLKQRLSALALVCGLSVVLSAQSQIVSRESDRLFLVGRELAFEHKYPEAIDTLKACFSADPQNIPALVLLGDSYLKIGHFPGAEQAYSQLLAAEPKKPRSYVKLAEVYYYWGKFDIALEYLKTGGQLSEIPDPLVLSWTGQILRESQRLAQSDSVLRFGIEHYPRSPELLANYGTTRTFMGDSGRARLYIDSAYRLDTMSLFAVNTLASFRMLTGDFPGAKVLLDRAQQIDLNDPFTQSNLLVYSQSLGNQAARAAFQEGNAFFEKALYRSARDSYLAALRKDSLFVEAYVNLGYAYIHLGEPENAVGAFGAAVGLKADLVPAYVGWGDAWLGQGQVDSALSKYQKALELDSGNATIRRIYEDTKALKARPEGGR